MSRPRADSWYASLEPMAMWDLYDKVRHVSPAERACDIIQAATGLSTSVSAYYRWLSWCRDHEVEHTLHNAARFAADTKRIVAEVGAPEDALKDGIAALAMDAASTRDLSTLKDLLKGLNQLRRVELDRVTAERDHLRAQVAELQAALAETDGHGPALTEAERDARIKQIFGLG